MKTRYISYFVFLLLFSSKINGQTYYPFPLKDARWNVGSSQFYVNSSISYFTSGDTLVNNKIYTKILYSGISCDNIPPYGCTGIGSSTPFLIREENKRVYYKPINDSEYVIFDFNIGIGDTIPPKYPHPALIVNKIDSIKLNDGIYRKRYISNTIENYKLEIIEGVGGLNLIDYIIPQNHYRTDYSKSLICMTIKDEVIYSKIDNFECKLITKSIDLNNQSIHLSSNVLYDQILLNFDSKQIKVNIYDLLGRKVNNLLATNAPLIISKENMSKGIYFLHCEDENRSHKVFKIIVE